MRKHHSGTSELTRQVAGYKSQVAGCKFASVGIRLGVSDKFAPRGCHTTRARPRRIAGRTSRRIPPTRNLQPAISNDQTLPKRKGDKSYPLFRCISRSLASSPSALAYLNPCPLNPAITPRSRKIGQLIDGGLRIHGPAICPGPPRTHSFLSPICHSLITDYAS